MKILVVTQYFWPEQFKINDLCEGLIERGHEVTVLTGFPNYPEGAIYKNYSILKGPFKENLGEINIYRVPLISRGKKKGIKLILNYISFFLSASFFGPFIVKGDFDKIFVYEPSPVTVAIPGIVFKYLKKAPMYFWVTDLWPESLEATGIVKSKKILNLISLFVSWLYKKSDKILITSMGFESQVIRLGAAKEKIIYFPQWAEDLYLNDKIVNLNDNKIPNTGFKIMFAGNIGSSQDFETIVKAACILKEYENIYFLILGDGLMKNWAENEVNLNNLQKNFIFLGRKPVESMPYYYSRADVLLISLTNTQLFSITLPAKLQTYLASKKPILASMNGECSEIISKWNAGLVCEASKPNELATKILEFSKKSKDELEIFGINSFTCYKSEFEREKLLSKLELEFYKTNGK